MAVTNLRNTFGAVYKVTDDGTGDSPRSDSTWCQEIRGRYGIIYPYGYDGSLAVRFDSKTKSKINAWAMRLTREGFKIVQRGDWEIVFRFALSKIDYMATLIKARKRRHLTPEERAKALAALARITKNTRHPVTSPNA